jgi:type II secretory pathway component PulM
MPVIGLALLLVVAAVAMAQPASDDLAQKQMTMLAAEVQFFSSLAKQQRDELDRLKAAPTPCPER